MKVVKCAKNKFWIPRNPPPPWSLKCLRSVVQYTILVVGNVVWYQLMEKNPVLIFNLKRQSKATFLKSRFSCLSHIVCRCPISKNLVCEQYFFYYYLFYVFDNIVLFHTCKNPNGNKPFMWDFWIVLGLLCYFYVSIYCVFWCCCCIFDMYILKWHLLFMCFWNAESKRNEMKGRLFAGSIGLTVAGIVLVNHFETYHPILYINNLYLPQKRSWKQNPVNIFQGCRVKI